MKMKLEEMTARQLDKWLREQGVYGQDEAVKSTSTLLYKHFRGYPSINLYCAPTGSGKTHIWRIIQKELGKEKVVIYDASTLTAEGWKGDNKISSLFASLDPNKREDIILVLDEVDKLIEPREASDGNYSAVVQNELLKLFDHDPLTYGKGETSFTVDTSRITIVLLGAFERTIKYKNITREHKDAVRRKTGHIGFRKEVRKEQEAEEEYNYGNSELTVQDFMKFGMRQEIAGRINNVISMKPLSHGDFVRIGKREVERLGREYDYNVSIDDATIENIAYESEKNGLGARNIKSRISNIFDEYIYNLTDAGKIKAVSKKPMPLEKNQQSFYDVGEIVAEFSLLWGQTLGNLLAKASLTDLSEADKRLLEGLKIRGEKREKIIYDCTNKILYDNSYQNTIECFRDKLKDSFEVYLRHHDWLAHQAKKPYDKNPSVITERSPECKEIIKGEIDSINSIAWKALNESDKYESEEKELRMSLGILWGLTIGYCQTVSGNIISGKRYKDEIFLRCVVFEKDKLKMICDMAEEYFSANSRPDVGEYFADKLIERYELDMTARRLLYGSDNAKAEQKAAQEECKCLIPKKKVSLNKFLVESLKEMDVEVIIDELKDMTATFKGKGSKDLKMTGYQAYENILRYGLRGKQCDDNEVLWLVLACCDKNGMDGIEYLYKKYYVDTKQ